MHPRWSFFDSHALVFSDTLGHVKEEPCVGFRPWGLVLTDRSTPTNRWKWRIDQTDDVVETVEETDDVVWRR